MTKLTEEARNSLALAYGLGPGGAAVYHMTRANTLANLAVAEQLRVANLIAYSELTLHLNNLLDMEPDDALATELGRQVLAGLDLEES